MRSALLLSLLAAAPAVAAEPIPVPDGIASADLSVAYVKNRAGGIDALDLASGRVRWTVPGPARPLLVLGSELVSLQPNRVVVHEPAGGKARLESKPLGIPAGVAIGGTYAQRESQEFSVRTKVEGNRLLLEWTATTTHVYGFRPADISKQTGGATVDLTSGAVTPLSAPLPPAPKPALPEPLQRAVQRSEGYSNINPPVVSNELASGIRMEDRGGRKALVLRRWAAGTAGKELPEAILPSEPRGTGLPVVLPSLDRQYAAVTWQYPDRDTMPKKIAHDVYALATAKKLGSFEAPAGLSDFAVVGARVLLRSGDRLVAMDFSGKQLWEYPLWTMPEFPPVP